MEHASELIISIVFQGLKAQIQLHGEASYLSVVKQLLHVLKQQLTLDTLALTSIRIQLWQKLYVLSILPDAEFQALLLDLEALMKTSLSI